MPEKAYEVAFVVDRKEGEYGPLYQLRWRGYASRFDEFHPGSGTPPCFITEFEQRKESTQHKLKYYEEILETCERWKRERKLCKSEWDEEFARADKAGKALMTRLRQLQNKNLSELERCVRQQQDVLIEASTDRAEGMDGPEPIEVAEADPNEAGIITLYARCRTDFQNDEIQQRLEERDAAIAAKKGQARRRKENNTPPTITNTQAPSPPPPPATSAPKPPNPPAAIAHTPIHTQLAQSTSESGKQHSSHAGLDLLHSVASASSSVSHSVRSSVSSASQLSSGSPTIDSSRITEPSKPSTSAASSSTVSTPTTPIPPSVSSVSSASSRPALNVAIVGEQVVRRHVPIPKPGMQTSPTSTTISTKTTTTTAKPMAIASPTNDRPETAVQSPPVATPPVQPPTQIATPMVIDSPIDDTKATIQLQPPTVKTEPTPSPASASPPSSVISTTPTAPVPPPPTTNPPPPTPTAASIDNNTAAVNTTTTPTPTNTSSSVTQSTSSAASVSSSTPSSLAAPKVVAAKKRPLVKSKSTESHKSKKLKTRTQSPSPSTVTKTTSTTSASAARIDTPTQGSINKQPQGKRKRHISSSSSSSDSSSSSSSSDDDKKDLPRVKSKPPPSASAPPTRIKNSSESASNSNKKTTNGGEAVTKMKKPVAAPTPSSSNATSKPLKKKRRDSSSSDSSDSDSDSSSSSSSSYFSSSSSSSSSSSDDSACVELDVDGQPAWYVTKLLQQRKAADGTFEFEVKWKGYKETTWEPEEHILNPQMITDLRDTLKRRRDRRRRNLQRRIAKLDRQKAKEAAKADAKLKMKKESSSSSSTKHASSSLVSDRRRDRADAKAVQALDKEKQRTRKIEEKKRKKEKKKAEAAAERDAPTKHKPKSTVSTGPSERSAVFATPNPSMSLDLKPESGNMMPGFGPQLIHRNAAFVVPQVPRKPAAPLQSVNPPPPPSMPPMRRTVSADSYASASSVESAAKFFPSMNPSGSHTPPPMTPIAPMPTATHAAASLVSPRALSMTSSPPTIHTTPNQSVTSVTPTRASPFAPITPTAVPSPQRCRRLMLIGDDQLNLVKWIMQNYTGHMNGPPLLLAGININEMQEFKFITPLRPEQIVDRATLDLYALKNRFTFTIFYEVPSDLNVLPNWYQRAKMNAPAHFDHVIVLLSPFAPSAPAAYIAPTPFAKAVFSDIRTGQIDQRLFKTWFDQRLMRNIDTLIDTPLNAQNIFYPKIKLALCSNASLPSTFVSDLAHSNRVRFISRESIMPDGPLLHGLFRPHTQPQSGSVMEIITFDRSPNNQTQTNTNTPTKQSQPESTNMARSKSQPDSAIDLSCEDDFGDDFGSHGDFGHDEFGVDDFDFGAPPVIEPTPKPIPPPVPVVASTPIFVSEENRKRQAEIDALHNVPIVMQLEGQIVTYVPTVPSADDEVGSLELPSSLLIGQLAPSASGSSKSEDLPEHLRLEFERESILGKWQRWTNGQTSARGTNATDKSIASPDQARSDLSPPMMCGSCIHPHCTAQRIHKLQQHITPVLTGPSQSSCVATLHPIRVSNGTTKRYELHQVTLPGIAAIPYTHIDELDHRLVSLSLVPIDQPMPPIDVNTLSKQYPPGYVWPTPAVQIEPPRNKNHSTRAPPSIPTSTSALSASPSSSLPSSAPGPSGGSVSAARKPVVPITRSKPRPQMQTYSEYHKMTHAPTTPRDEAMQTPRPMQYEHAIRSNGDLPPHAPVSTSGSIHPSRMQQIGVNTPTSVHMPSNTHPSAPPQSTGAPSLTSITTYPPPIEYAPPSSSYATPTPPTSWNAYPHSYPSSRNAPGPSHQPHPTPSRPECSFFRRGKCKRGAYCQFAHVF